MNTILAIVASIATVGIKVDAMNAFAAKPIASVVLSPEPK